MRARAAMALAVLLAAVAVAAEAATQWFGPPDAVGVWWFDLLNSGVPSILAAVAVGLVVLRHQRGNAVGWVLLAGAAAFSISGFANAYVVRALEGGWPGVTAAAWMSVWVWGPGFLCFFFLLPLVFPTGTLPSPRWRVPVTLFLVVAGAQFLGLMFSPGPFAIDAVRAPIENPLGVPGVERLLAVADPLAETTFPLALLLAVAALVVRYRRGSAMLRLQVRWLLLGFSLVTASFVLSILPAFQAIAPWYPMGLFVAALPAAVGVAVTRYRLYEIDRLISRTVSYALVTAVLVGLYLAGVLVLTPAVAALGGGSTAAVAGSTLLVAAGFGPVRRRVQGVVDRRFNRARYDAERTIDGFRNRLRGEVDLEDVRADLLSTVDAVVAPAGAGIWLRADAAR